MRITKNSIVRAFRTFFQSAVAYFAVNIAIVDFSSGRDAVKSAVIGVIMSALAGGISAVMNMEGEENSNDIR